MKLPPFTLSSGEVLDEPVVAYEEYGVPDGPVALICHGGFSHHRAAGPGGYWDGLIGPGRAIDTERLRVLSPNSLGGLAGTTVPRGEFTLEDSVRFFKAFLDALGVTRLELAAGLSMGSCQCLQLAALYPELVARVAAVATAGRAPIAAVAIHRLIINLLRLDPVGGLKSVYLLSRLYYNHERGMRRVCWADTAAERERKVEAFLWEGLDSRLASWDAHSISLTLAALNTYDLFAGGIERVRCPLLLVNFLTDQEFAPASAQEVKDALGEQVRLELLDSDWGHLGCIHETAALAPLFRDFIRSA